MPNGSNWYWEIVSQDHEILACGVSDTHVDAREDAEFPASKVKPAMQTYLPDRRYKLLPTRRRRLSHPVSEIALLIKCKGGKVKLLFEPPLPGTQPMLGA
jgi:hypothetical protein